MSESRAQGVIFPDLAKKPVEVQFDLPMATSDGGAMLLRAADQALDLSTTLASCLQDRRDPNRVQHDLLDLLRQRMYSIALGYEDANDASRLKDDAMHQSLVQGSRREPRRLASQPTLSRFENAVSRTACYRLSAALADGVLARHRRRLRRVEKITIDLDGSVDPTHGGQQLSLFSGFYGTWCYLPLFGFVAFNEEAEQYLFAAMLRPGAINERLGVLGVLRRILQRIRASFPKARVLVRLDAGFAGPEMFDFLEQEQVDYVVAMPRNRVLEDRAAVSEVDPLAEPGCVQV